MNYICTRFNVPGLCCLLRPYVVSFYSDKSGFFRYSGRKRIQNVDLYLHEMQRSWTLLPSQASCHFTHCPVLFRVPRWFGMPRHYRVSNSSDSRHDSPVLWCLCMGYSWFSRIFYFSFHSCLTKGKSSAKGTAFVSYSAEPLSHLQGPALVCEHGQHS